jgi:lipid A ethanolaminephosphotransferase
MVAALVLFVLLPAWWVWRVPVVFAPGGRQALRNLGTAGLGLGAAALAVLLVFQPLASAMRNHKQLRYLMNPLNSLYAVGQAAAQPLRRPAAIVPLGQDARVAAPAPGARPPLLMLVLGETARSDHLGLNGYARDTTPNLAREGAVSWREARSCGTSTAASVPCMFSHLGRAGFNARDRDYENLLDVLDHAGLAVLWLDNQAGCKGVCDRVPHASTAGSKDPALCAGGECLDGVMLQGLDERIAALPAERRARGVVLVLHQMGSHGPAYSRRSPEESKHWQPECGSVNLQDCSGAWLVNAYDNSIAYTDRFLGDAIGWLQREGARYDTAMLWVSDHGESLGENNLYLHGLPYALAPDVQKHVPWVTWVSAGFSQRTGVGTECLRALRDAPVSHDNYFHAVLGLMQVQTSVYRRARDPYAACNAH